MKEIKARAVVHTRAGAVISANEQKKSDYLTRVGRYMLQEKSVKSMTGNGVSNGSRVAKVGTKTKDS
ncbi:MAG: hypothetical protein GX052_04975 [Syntrophomonadaceae bacterium]|nr:hypothetical protein [Syntrophomonadaceae bacterium]